MKRAGMVDLLRSAGCGDRGCDLRPPGGQATNGGCRCWMDVKGVDRVRLRVLSRLVRELVLRLPENES